MQQSSSIKSFTDQMGRKVDVLYPPQKIISLVPSQTELLHYLGLENETAGITKFCIHPKSWFKNKTRVGGTKNLNFDVIDKIKPDIIIGNKEENEKEQIELLAQKYPLWMSDINNTEDALSMIKAIGALTNKEAEAITLIEKIKQEFLLLKSQKYPSLKVLYFIWNKPYMLAGKNTYINHVLELCKFTNIAPAGRYPEITNEQITTLKPDLILLSSEPFPFKDKHIKTLKKLLPQAQIKIVDGELFSWYGPRMLHAPTYLKNLLEEVHAAKGIVN